mgnify:CR=1 FL=1
MRTGYDLTFCCIFSMMFYPDGCTKDYRNVGAHPNTRSY